ncbi:hypothetical protein F5148DRAFT_1264270 [Russula earlei]|uniref:Uncharacterized protein n=1 Tax=Russula earlei TaxID=71964 RepID=A0ACC0TTB0_9AGAM|nr:hypothetical protein F5148DRAFT_1264270 [Russula earlei]
MQHTFSRWWGVLPALSAQVSSNITCLFLCTSACVFPYTAQPGPLPPSDASLWCFPLPPFKIVLCPHLIPWRENESVYRVAPFPASL